MTVPDLIFLSSTIRLFILSLLSNNILLSKVNGMSAVFRSVGEITHIGICYQASSLGKRDANL